MSFNHFLQSFAACCCGLLISCTADDRPERLSLVTFNAMAAEHGPHPEERLTAIAKAVNDLRPDVLCVQEVWLLEHVERLVKAVKTSLPHAHFTVRAGSSATHCETSERDSLVACVDEHCHDMTKDELPSCAVASCATEFAAVSRGCQECVLSNAESAESIDDVALSCSEGSNEPTYERQNGLVLLSAFPFREKDDVVLTSRIFERGVLHAELDAGFESPLDVFCTHLAATLALDADPEDDTTGERAQQIDETLDFIDDKHSKGDVTTLLGDVNCGPVGKGVEGADIRDFERIGSRGLETPYQKAPFCTWCTKNNLVDDTDKEQMIDHVFFSDLPDSYQATTRRVFDEEVILDVDGDELSSALSDHYGVEVSLSK